LWHELWHKWTGEDTLGTDAFTAIFNRRQPQRQAPAMQLMMDKAGEYGKEYRTQMRELWRATSTMATYYLWIYRNQVVHQHENHTSEHVVHNILSALYAHFNGISRYRRSTPEGILSGIILQRCIEGRFRNKIAAPTTAPAHPEQTRPKQEEKYRMYYDGGSRGNPGVAGSGWFITKWDRTQQAWTPKRVGYKYLGPKASNNQAEYTAVREGIAKAIIHEDRKASWEIVGDSYLVTKQLQGQWATKNSGMSSLNEEVQNLLTKLPSHILRHTRRHHNKTADLLANMAMDSKTSADDEWSQVQARPEHTKLKQYAASDANLTRSSQRSHSTLRRIVLAMLRKEAQQ
jgi:ribonuclease HI